MEIRQLEIDLDKRILKINGKDFLEKPIVVSLPGPEGWPLSMLVNAEKATGNPKDYAELTVCIKVPNNKP